MKTTIFYLVLLALTGCTKEKPPAKTLSGKWLVVENLQDPGDGRIVSSRPDKAAQIEFTADGQFTLSGNTHHYLKGFDRYQLNAGGSITFYKTAAADSTTAHFTLDNHLLVNYATRCYTAEKFARTP